MFKGLSEYITKIIRGEKVQINGQGAQWKKVDRLRPGMKIAVINNDQFSNPNLQSNFNDPISNENSKIKNSMKIRKSRIENSEKDIVFEEVVSIEHVGRERVWDIEVEGTHNFIANGILAHNTYLSGNVGIGTTAPGHPLEMGSGAHVTAGGVWTDNSSRDVKENFINLDLGEILDKLGQLPIQSWNYKVEDPSIRHIGPMAEDFYEMFNIGNDNKHLAALNTSGVALAGVKGLLLQLDESNNRENYNILNLTVTGELEIQGIANFRNRAEFEEKTIFQALAEFFNEVIFRGTVNFFGKVKHLADVSFLGRTTFNQDAGGFAIVKKGQKEVEIVFAREYKELPVVTTAISLTPKAVLSETPSYGIALSTTKGFKIKLDREIGEDLRFAWTAIAVENAKTFSSAETTETDSQTAEPTDAPAPATEPDDQTAPEPTDAPAEPTITLAPTPTATPTAAPIVEPTTIEPTPEPTAAAEPTPEPTAVEPTESPSPTPTLH